jgi:3-oxoacyl-[acyl-carrier protein] reductase
MSNGISVSLFDIDSAAAEKTTDELNDKYSSSAISVECDIRKSDDIETAIEQTKQELGNIEILVNNAGIGAISRIWEMSQEDWEQIVDINLNGVFLCTKGVLNHMLENDVRPGAIVNIGSLNYKAASGGMSAYSATKAGVSQMAKTVAGEVGRYGIRVNTIAPGSVQKSETETTPLKSGKSGEEFLNRVVLERRLGQPDDVAKVAAFLVSDYAGWITGETICVDGGQHIRGLHSYWDALNGEGRFADDDADS